MKVVKGFAKYLGITWMIIFGGFGPIYHLSSQHFNFNSESGIPTFLGVLLGILIMFSPGYFLYRWGTKSKNKKSKKEIDLQEIEPAPIEVITTKEDANQGKETSNQIINIIRFDLYKTPEKQAEEKLKKLAQAQKVKSTGEKVKIGEARGQVFPVNYLPEKEYSEPSLDKKDSKDQFTKQFVEMDYMPDSTWIQKGKEKFFPYVNMPKAGTKVLLPNPGKLKSSGVTEAGFKMKLLDAFGKSIFSQHFLVFEGAKNNYEPDFIFQESSRGLLIDIEIDEPYSGKSRKPMHYEGNSDIDRDHYFNKNGWVVIRFAEEQIVKNPQGCLLYIAAVADSLLGTDYSGSLLKAGSLARIKRWTYEEAEQMAKDFYREKYLGIEFEIEPEAYEEIETEIQFVKENRSPYGFIDITYRDTAIGQLSDEESHLINLIEEIKNKSLFCTFNYANSSIQLVQPIRIETTRSVSKLIAYDFIQNKEQEFEVRLISDLIEIQSPFYQTLDSNQGLTKLREAMDLAINNMLYVRFTYTNANYENSLRTLGPLDYTQEFDGWGYHRQHIAGYCHYRKENRSFRIDRIRQLWILNFGFD
ncbi:hypothetical protein SAMN03080617_04163 [Algoriphagus alkaliphilus]|uniref:DUF559 domain-containing protein n=1 Tax=Algoriphagus alkaliphilus TaxID=279824 RepID=A0A1G5ZNX9_9BACT|nr:hypothetical protein [Algoriphagus alkaliphilus]SDA96003.1 hypothetical protein SAMN03080617_04163 [Algoriphagus alkaliphilus]